MRWLPLASILCAIACGNGERRGSVPNHTVERPSVRLAILTDLQGQLEPCGCQSRPLGGIDRLATEVARLRDDGTPLVLLATGELLFRPDAGHGHGTDPAAAQQDRWRAETVVEALNRLQVAAVNPGGADWADRAQFDAIITGLKARNLAPIPGKDLQSFVVEGDPAVGVVGIGVDTDLSKLPATEASLRAAGAKILVALVTGDRRTANQVARAASFDFVVSGGTDTKLATPPSAAGRAHVLSAGRHGEGLLVLDVFRVGDGPFTDASPWSRERARDALKRSIDELTARIAAWERDANVDRAAVDAQKQRLANLEAERADAPNAVVTGNRFIASLREIGPEITRDPALDAVINAYDRRVNEHNRVALADVKAPPAAEGQPHYVGSAQCQSCHQKAFAWWTGHKHGHAYATLEEANKQFNLSCVGCHVTGYNKPGGSAVVQNAGLINVGCESCHGPGSQHVDDPDEEPYSVQRVVPEAVCVECHNTEHSDKFDYGTYRAKLLVPGHGQPFVAPPENQP